ncbi:MAG: hypothetical protein D6B25_10020 [Desulfobulbaceae bacterium]|nr:MAG: hypothetical protein D6B25_10020 [Desulfobulbaceae bacterium]
MDCLAHDTENNSFAQVPVVKKPATIQSDGSFHNVYRNAVAADGSHGRINSRFLQKMRSAHPLARYVLGDSDDNLQTGGEYLPDDSGYIAKAIHHLSGADVNPHPLPVVSVTTRPLSDSLLSAMYLRFS